MLTKPLFSKAVLSVAMLGMALVVSAQSSFDIIMADRSFGGLNYCAYPDTLLKPLTPAPEGMKPFYISHYGRHGSRYLGNRKGYDIPYNVLHRADSLGKLTPFGKEVLREIAVVRADAEGRWGDLTDLGREQHRAIARRMMERFPEVFEGKANIDARSTTVIRCILSMGSALQQLRAMNPQLRVRMDASQHDMWYMNYQDRQLRDSMMTHNARKAYEEFIQPRAYNPALMARIFNDSNYVREQIDGLWLNYYIVKAATMQQNTHMRDSTHFFNYITEQDIHRFWLNENAWWYIMYGPSLLNGGKQPYTQRNLLRRIISEADSCIALAKPGASLRYGHETMVLPLTCLLGLNGYGFQTLHLDEVEPSHWWAAEVFPMAANVQFVFYRRRPGDKDVLFKVLLNENEATLPIPTDVAPYYHWNEFRDYYLKKLDAYESD